MQSRQSGGPAVPPPQAVVAAPGWQDPLLAAEQHPAPHGAELPQMKLQRCVARMHPAELPGQSVFPLQPHWPPPVTAVHREPLVPPLKPAAHALQAPPLLPQTPSAVPATQ